jgi:hypothetical protein
MAYQIQAKYGTHENAVERDLVPIILQLDAVYNISWAWSSMNLVMLIQSRRKHIPDLEQDELQGFHNE